MRRPQLILLALVLPFAASCEAWRLESAARAKCERGLARIRKVVNAPDPSDLSYAQKLALLREGVHLIRDGMSSYAAASEKFGKNYDAARYLEAVEVARMKILELND
jgi:hypothetical protein